MEIQKSFNDCSLIYLEKTFGLRQTHTTPGLENWLSLAKEISLSNFEKEELRLCQESLLDNVLHWNEQELSLHFIGPVLSLTRFTSPKRLFNLFAERFISATVENLNHEAVVLSGKPDGIVASGYREPESPFFAFTEYKKHKEPNGEPEGQCLAALLAGQALNQFSEKPMYGCYVLGRDWYFMTLSNKNYCISRGFDGTTDDVFELFQLLKALKEIIIKHTD